MSAPKVQFLIYRGLKASLPTSAPDGELLLTTDTHELYVGTGTSVVQITGGGGGGGAVVLTGSGVPTASEPDGSWYIDTDTNNVYVMLAGIWMLLTNTLEIPNPLDVNVGNFPESQHVTVDNPVAIVEVSNLPATQPVSGSVSVANFPASQHVTIDNPTDTVEVSNFPASQHVTVDNPTSSVEVSNLPAVQHVVVDNPTETVEVTNFPATQPVSGNIGVTGDVAVVNSGSTKLAVTADPVTFASPQHVVLDSGSVSVSNFPEGSTADPLICASGQATATGDTVMIAAPGAGNKIRVQRITWSNSASTDLLVGYKFGAGSVQGKAFLNAQGGAWVHNLIPLGHLASDNDAVSINLSGTGQIEWTVWYTVEAA